MWQEMVRPLKTALPEGGIVVGGDSFKGCCEEQVGQDSWVRQQFIYMPLFC